VLCADAFAHASGLGSDIDGAIAGPATCAVAETDISISQMKMAT
jgi:hypothetical protein